MYRASTENKGDSKHYATTKNHHFMMDTAGQASNPVDALLASLCACLGHNVRDYLREKKHTYNAFTISASAEPTEDQKRLSDINVSIDLKDTQLDEHQRDELLKYVERCKVYNTLKANSRILITLAQFDPVAQR